MKTNRRSFIKQVTGFVAGICAACIPQAKRKRPPTKKDFQDALTEVVKEKLRGLPNSMSSRQLHLVGSCLVTDEGLRFRYVRKPTGTELLGRKTTRPFWCWVPEDDFIAHPPEEFLTMLKVEL